jgi:hypothetical protein
LSQLPQVSGGAGSGGFSGYLDDDDDDDVLNDPYDTVDLTGASLPPDSYSQSLMVLEEAAPATKHLVAGPLKVAPKFRLPAFFSFSPQEKSQAENNLLCDGTANSDLEANDCSGLLQRGDIGSSDVDSKAREGGVLYGGAAAAAAAVGSDDEIDHKPGVIAADQEEKGDVAIHPSFHGAMKWDINKQPGLRSSTATGTPSTGDAGTKLGHRIITKAPAGSAAASLASILVANVPDEGADGHPAESDTVVGGGVDATTTSTGATANNRRKKKNKEKPQQARADEDPHYHVL